jgi:hypothetical protein
MRRPRQPALTQSKGWLAGEPNPSGVEQGEEQCFFRWRDVRRAISAHHVPREILLDIKEKLFDFWRPPRAWHLMVKRRSAERRSRISRTLHSQSIKSCLSCEYRTQVSAVGQKRFQKDAARALCCFILGEEARGRCVRASASPECGSHIKRHCAN